MSSTRAARNILHPRAFALPVLIHIREAQTLHDIARNGLVAQCASRLDEAELESGFWHLEEDSFRSGDSRLSLGRIQNTKTLELSEVCRKNAFTPHKETVRVGLIEMKNERNALVGIGLLRGFEFSNSARNDL